jgi:hypothetical protein
MIGQSEPSIQQNANGQFEVHLMDGSKITCQSQEDAELVLDAVRRFYLGNKGRLPIRTLDALERAGLNATNSMLYRSVLHYLAPHLKVPLTQLQKVETVLKANKIPYWVDEEVLSLDGKPEIAFINLSRESDPEMVRKLLNGIL